MQYLFKAADQAAIPETKSVHQFNNQAVRHVRALTDLAGLSRIGMHVVRLETGCDSTELHSHDNDEEFLVILQGNGVATIGTDTVEVTGGDIMAFPCGSPPHKLHNPNSEDLIYLMGGEKNANDVVHYPRLQRSMVKSADKRYWSDWNDQHELPKKF